MVYSSRFNQDRQTMATALANRRNGNIVPMLPREKKAGLSPRAYQARLDLCRLWDLVCMQKSQTEIAEIMGKDAAWVCRSIKRIQADFSIVYATPTEERIISENLARLESLYAETLRTAFASTGHTRVYGLRIAADILDQQAQYQITVGYVANRRSDAEKSRSPTIEELRSEISTEDLKSLFVTVADQIKKKRMKAANAERDSSFAAARQTSPN